MLVSFFIDKYKQKNYKSKNILKEHAGKCRINKKKKNSAKIVSLRERIGCAVMVLTDNSNYCKRQILRLPLNLTPLL